MMEFKFDGMKDVQVKTGFKHNKKAITDLLCVLDNYNYLKCKNSTFKQSNTFSGANS